MKKTVKIAIFLLCMMTILTGCGKKTNITDGIKSNTNEDVIKDQKVEVFEFTNTSLLYEEGRSKLEVTVTNTSDEIAYLSEFKIHVKDENENEIIELIGFVGEQIEPKESRLITSYSIQDLTNASSISYEIVK